MMCEKHMLDLYCAEAASTAVYLMNRCTTDGVHELTPYEILVGRKPILSHLKVLGSIAKCTHPERRSREARREVGRMYPRRILVCEKGIQVLQPFDTSSSDKSSFSTNRHLSISPM